MFKVVRNIIIVILLALSVYFGYLAYTEGEPLVRSKAQQKAIKEVAVVEVSDDPYDRVVDFEALRNINSDIVGWIYIPNTSIDYPILIGGTDEEYLYKDMEGNYSELGSIFSYANTNKDLLDGVTFLFAHNMLQYQMFGELRRYLDDDFRSQHPKIYVYTGSRTVELGIYSIFTCRDDDALFDNVGIEAGTPEYRDLLLEIQSRNEYSGIGVDNIGNMYDNRTFSLVTCNGEVGTVYRLIVNGLVEREKYVIN